MPQWVKRPVDFFNAAFGEVYTETVWQLEDEVSDGGVMATIRKVKGGYSGRLESDFSDLTRIFPTVKLLDTAKALCTDAIFDAQKN